MRLISLIVGELYYNPISMQHYTYQGAGSLGGYTFYNLHTTNHVRLYPVDILALETSQLNQRAVRSMVGVSACG